MLAAFLAGAAAYPMVELAWRGRTHPAMALAGGVSLAVLRGVSRMQKGRPLWQQALLGGLMITGVEYAFGLIFNRRIPPQVVMNDGAGSCEIQARTGCFQRKNHDFFASVILERIH